MKESGINYFMGQIGLNDNPLQVFYTFDENTGNLINSVPSGNGLYTGVLSSIGNFWEVPNSGFCTGQTITMQNASGLYSNNWTKLFVYEKTTPGHAILFSNLIAGSGYEIGINDANKIYLKAFNNQNYIFTSYNNIGSKNVIAICYNFNSINFGYFDFAYQRFETETVNFNFSLTESDAWTLLPSYTGYIDYFLYFNQTIHQATLASICSGLYNVETGNYAPVSGYNLPVVTGFQALTVYQTGITGYVSIPSGGNGIGNYSGFFSSSGITTPLTGIIAQITQSIPITGLVLMHNTGDSQAILQLNTGYAASFGMDKCLILFPVESYDLTKYSFDQTPFNNFYNIPTYFYNSGFFINEIVYSGGVNLFYNGQAQSNNDYSVRTGYVMITGSLLTDDVILDLISGQKTTWNNSGLIPINYSGQQIFLNGVNLISGVDFVSTGIEINLMGPNTGIVGIVFEFPFSLSFGTGNKALINEAIKFTRYSSNIYINGIRSSVNNTAFEGAAIDLLSGNDYNHIGALEIYDNNDQFWEQ